MYSRIIGVKTKETEIPVAEWRKDTDERYAASPERPTQIVMHICSHRFLEIY